MQSLRRRSDRLKARRPLIATPRLDVNQVNGIVVMILAGNLKKTGHIHVFAVGCNYSTSMRVRMLGRVMAMSIAHMEMGGRVCCSRIVRRVRMRTQKALICQETGDQQRFGNSTQHD